MKSIWIFIIGLLLSAELYAETAQVSAEIDTNDVLIGDQITLQLLFYSDSKKDVLWAEIPDNFDKIEVLKKGIVDTIITESSFKLKANYKLTSFDEGELTIPSLTFSYLNSQESPEYLFTEPIPVKYSTVEVDTTAEIKDIKAPLEVGADWTELLLYTLLILVVLIAFYLAYNYWFKKREPKAEELDYDPNIPAHVVALEALRQLEDEKLWQANHYKDYYVRMTDIVRKYIKRRLDIDALEMITSEIIEALQQSKIEAELIGKMKELFETADLSKFAKFQPLGDINTKCMTHSYDFVNHTKEDIDETNNEGAE